MTWLRIDDDFPDHPKIHRLSDAAFRLHVRVMCHCAKYNTDGEIEKSRVAGWAKPKVIRECLSHGPNSEHGVWEERNETYFVHDFLEYNPSRADIEDARSKKADAGRKGAAARLASISIAPATANGVARAKASARAPAQATVKQYPVPSRPDRDPVPITPVAPLGRGRRRQGAGRADPVRSPKIRAAIDAIEGGL